MRYAQQQKKLDAIALAQFHLSAETDTAFRGISLLVRIKNASTSPLSCDDKCTTTNVMNKDPLYRIFDTVFICRLS